MAAKGKRALPAVTKAAWWRRQMGAGRGAALLLLAALLALRGLDPLPLEVARAKLFDFYQTLRPAPTPPERPVMIVDLDEASLAEIGQWPWPRNLLARLTDRLTEAGAAAVAYDIVFAEPDRLSPDLLRRALPGLDPSLDAALGALPSNDALFAEAIARGRVVLGEGTVAEDLGGQEAPGASVAQIGGDPCPWLPHFAAVRGNIPILAQAAAGRGVFSTDPEADGVVRRVPAMIATGEALHPALSVELLRVATGNRSLGIKVSDQDGGIQGIVVRPNLVRTDGMGSIWIYASRHDPDKFIPARDVLAGRFDPARLAGRLVLVGTSATGLGDIRSTAVERHIPGVEIHAQILETVLGDRQLSRPALAAAAEASAAAVIGLLLILLVPMVAARWTLGLLAAACAAVVAGSWHFFTGYRELYDPVFPILSALLLFILLTYAAHAREEQRRREVRGAFSRYMSPALVEQLAADPSRLRLGGEMRDMTLLFCDVRGFTTISELYDAQGLTKLINRFLTPMTDVILAHRGTIDKYMGDCIMAFWNAPLDDADHAVHACQSALAMAEQLAALNAVLEAEALAQGRRHVPLAVGIGLNSGEVCVGNMGSDQRFDYSVLGDHVNLASRLEGQSKTYGVTTVISQAVLDSAPGFATLELDLIKVKGKTEAVRIHSLLGDAALFDSQPFQTLHAEHDAMLAAYRAQDWYAARFHLARCRELDDFGLKLDGLYDLYADRIANFEHAPPAPDWDGVHVATSK